MPEKKTTPKSKNTSGQSKKTTTAKKEDVAVKTVQQSAQNPYLVPASIVVAGAFIALALFFSGGGAEPQPSQPAGNDRNGEPQVAGDISFNPVSEDDHILGDLDAPVKIIEYMDYNCGFCQRAHPTLHQLVENNDGQVAWVTRHLTVLGDDSVKKAEASECVAELGGNDAFWTFTDLLYSDQYFQAPESQLATIAVEAGVNRSAFQSCLDSGRHSDTVNAHNEDARNAGGQGTPYSLVVAPNGEAFPVSGAQPLAAFQAAVDQALEQN